MALLFGTVGSALVLGACSGDDATPEDATDDAQPDDVVIGGDDLDAPALVLSDVAADGDALFPCVGEPGPGTLRLVYVQQLPVDHVGPLADAFRAAVGDYQRRCGGVAAGALEVEVGYAASAPGGDVCALEPVDGATVVVTDAADDETADCLAAADRLLWHEGGASDPSVAAGTDAPPAVRAANAVAAAIAEGVVGERSVVVLHDGSTRLARAVDTGVLPTLDAASVDVDITQAACDGAGSTPDLDGAFVIALVPADCLATLTASAAGLGADVRWLVIEDALSLAPLDEVQPDAAAFDTALAYEFAPTVVTGLPRDRAPVARDQACVAFLDSFTGHQTEFPGAAFTAHARLCSTIGGVIAALHAAGDDPTPATILGAVSEVAPPLVLSQGQRRGASPDPWLAPAVFTTVEWNADCACWTYVRGPDLAPVD